MIIEYQGQRFKLTKTYDDYEQYVDDENNLDASENSRIAQAVATAAIPRECMTTDEIVEAVSSITFPGFGSGTLAPTREDDIGILVGMKVEIPRTENDRHILYQKQGDTFVLIDDFVAPRDPKIYTAQVEGDTISYHAGRNVVIKRDANRH